ncbi:hypothetical protein SM124_09685 [Bacillus sp. 31A1R]|uniref:Phr family secreted Rap phosphatase inhibitor n=1 Tax=Robertmurraya mangrovi TaxID=3098077 RepID=A0ABU5IY03_9BACI|nr:hypothetical protein [Bacillus sp. 31A1R]MDZ5472016.1 hypothetical protein [Bacillus sp. 31A1R]
MKKVLYSIVVLGFVLVGSFGSTQQFSDVEINTGGTHPIQPPM